MLFHWRSACVWFFQIDIEVNGEPVDLHMKLGDNGEAFFVQESELQNVSTPVLFCCHKVDQHTRGFECYCHFHILAFWWMNATCLHERITPGSMTFLPCALFFHSVAACPCPSGHLPDSHRESPVLDLRSRAENGKRGGWRSWPGRPARTHEHTGHEEEEETEEEAQRRPSKRGADPSNCSPFCQHYC